MIPSSVSDLVFFVCWLFLFAALYLYNFSPAQVHYCADQSEIVQTADRLRSGVVVTRGPPSRDGVHNVGSLYYVVIAIIRTLAHGSIFATQIIHSFLIASAFFFASVVLTRISASKLIGIATATALYSFDLPHYFAMVIWGPASNFALMLAAVFIAGRLASESILPVIALALIASLLVQTHYAFFFPAGSTVLTTIYLLRKKPRRILHFILWLFVFTIPAILDVIKEPENLLRIITLNMTPGQAARTQSFSDLPNAILSAVDFRGWHPGLSVVILLIACAGLLAAFIRPSPDDSRASSSAQMLAVTGMIGATILSMSLVREKVQLYYLPALVLILPFGIAALVRSLPQARMPLAVFCVLIASPGLASNYEKFSRSDWNACPYDEMQGIVDAIHDPVFAIVTTGEDAPRIVPTILRLLGERRPDARAKALYIVEPAEKTTQGNLVFSGRKWRMVRQTF